MWQRVLGQALRRFGAHRQGLRGASGAVRTQGLRGASGAVWTRGLLAASGSVQARQAVADGADYLGSGAWFPTETKKDAVPITEEAYRAILAAAPIPNVAVGGIDAENGRKPLSCGATGLDISAGILKARTLL